MQDKNQDREFMNMIVKKKKKKDKKSKKEKKIESNLGGEKGSKMKQKKN